MITALASKLGVVTDACNEVGIARKTHYEWYKEDAEYAEAVDDIANVSLDFAESMLYQRMREKDTTAIIFYLKTRGKARGYVERQEITGKDGEPIIPIIKFTNG